MKKFLVLIFCLFSSLRLSAQLSYNEKAPEIVIDSYLYGVELKSGLPTIVDFFMADAQHNQSELTALNAMARKYSSNFNFLVVTKSNSVATVNFFNSINEPLYYSVGYDSQGVTFKNFRVRYLPYSVIIDKTGKFVWQGKSSQLTTQIIKQYME